MNVNVKFIYIREVLILESFTKRKIVCVLAPPCWASKFRWVILRVHANCQFLVDFQLAVEVIVLQ